MAGEELHSCLRIHKQCVRENRALLGLVARPVERVPCWRCQSVPPWPARTTASLGSGLLHSLCSSANYPWRHGVPPSSLCQRLLIPLAASGAQVAQGNVRMLWLRDARGRTVARATVRLLGQADTHAPLLLLDQPLYAGLCDDATQARAPASELASGLASGLASKVASG